MSEPLKLVIKKRCIYCHKVLRDDGTCSNEECIRYVPEFDDETQETESV